MPTGWPARSSTSRMPPHDLILALDRLIRIGVGADRDGARLIVRRRQFLLQQRRRVRLHEQLGFEIEPGRQPEIGVGRPREAIDAAMLAAAIGIDRAVEGDVGRLVAGDDLARGVDRHGGLERRQLFEALPAVVEGDPRDRLVAAGGIRQRAAAAPAVTGDAVSGAKSFAANSPPARRAPTPTGCGELLMNEPWLLSNPSLRTKQERIPTQH